MSRRDSTRRVASPSTPAIREARVICIGLDSASNSSTRRQRCHRARLRAAGKRNLRDYASLAGLAGYGRDEYEGMDARDKRVARLAIDRELAARLASSGLGRGVQIAEPPATGGKPQRAVPRGAAARRATAPGVDSVGRPAARRSGPSRCWTLVGIDRDA